MMRTLPLLVCVVSLLLGGGAKSDAARIYQWKDVDGIVHFADNPMAVPPEYRKSGQRDVKSLQGTGKGSEQVTTALTAFGQRVWREHCMECHTLERTDADGKRSLFRLIVDPVTRYPASLENIEGNIEYAVTGRTTEMDPIDLSEEEIRALAAYLHEAVR